METFVKLYGSIIHSSIWSQPDHVRLVWITMLAMADANGVVHASPLGIANASRQSIELTLNALDVLMGPDPYSRDGTTGERVLKVDRGYVILNHTAYRNLRTPKQVYEAERKAAYRASKADETVSGHVPNVPGTSGDSVYVYESNLSGSVEEREHEREETPKPSRTKSVPKPDKVDQQHWNDWLAARRAKRAGPVTETVLKMLIKEANLAGITLDKAVYYAAASNWITFKAAYMVGKQWDEVRKNDPDRWESSGEKYEDIDGDTPLF